LLKNLHITKQKLVQQIDEVIYLLTKTQYESHISKKDLGGDPCMAMMKEMFKSGHFEYLDNIALIKENVGKVELLLQKQVATPEKRDEITHLQKKMKKLMFRRNLVGIFCSIFTLGTYKLFW
jgi:dihydroxyacid dehydratase/phosphogluconate dehydratase